MSGSRACFRRRAVERQRDPSQDARNEAATAAIRQHVAEQLLEMPLVQRTSGSRIDCPALSPARNTERGSGAGSISQLDR